MRIPTIFRGLVATGTITALTFISLPIIAQNAPVDLSGIWWSGAAVPLLPGESPAMGMGMGMGASSSPLMPTDYGLEIMADFDPADDPAVRCVQSGLVRTFNSPYPIEIVQSGDTVTIEYEEWEVLRTVHVNGSIPEDPRAQFVRLLDRPVRRRCPDSELNGRHARAREDRRVPLDQRRNEFRRTLLADRARPTASRARYHRSRHAGRTTALREDLESLRSAFARIRLRVARSITHHRY